MQLDVTAARRILELGEPLVSGDKAMATFDNRDWPGDAQRRPLNVRHLLQQTARELRVVWSTRRTNLWLSVVAVPLALTASVLVGDWLAAIPLIAGAIACAPGQRREWIMALELGLVGAEWCYVGASALATWPDRRLLVGAVWIGCAAALAFFGLENRRGSRRLR